MDKFEIDKIYILNNESFICKNHDNDKNEITFYNTKTSTSCVLKCYNFHDETEIVIMCNKIYTPKYSKYFLRFEVGKQYVCGDIVVKLLNRNENSAVFEVQEDCTIKSYSGTDILKFKQNLKQDDKCEYFYITSLYGKDLKFNANNFLN